MLNKIERNGKIDQAKGHVKQAVGALTGSDNLKAEGMLDETVGRLEEAVGRVGRIAGDAIARADESEKP